MKSVDFLKLLEEMSHTKNLPKVEMILKKARDSDNYKSIYHFLRRCIRNDELNINDKSIEKFRRYVEFEFGIELDFAVYERSMYSNNSLFDLYKPIESNARLKTPEIDLVFGSNNEVLYSLIIPSMHDGKSTIVHADLTLHKNLSSIYFKLGEQIKSTENSSHSIRLLPTFTGQCIFYERQISLIGFNLKSSYSPPVIIYSNEFSFAWECCRAFNIGSMVKDNSFLGYSRKCLIVQNEMIDQTFGTHWDKGFWEDLDPVIQGSRDWLRTNNMITDK